MRELAAALVPAVVEAGGRGHPLDVRLVAGQEVPGARRRVRVPVVHVRALLFRRHVRRIARIEADEHHVEIPAGTERHGLERARDSIHHLRAQHRALQVHEREDDGSAAEVIAERDALPALIPERGVERELLVEALLERHLSQLLRLLVRRCPRFRLVSIAGRILRLRAHARICKAQRTKHKAQRPNAALLPNAANRGSSREPCALCLVPCHRHCLLCSIVRPELESAGISREASTPAGCAASCGRDGRPRSTVRRIASAIGM